MLGKPCLWVFMAALQYFTLFKCDFWSNGHRGFAPRIVQIWGQVTEYVCRWAEVCFLALLFFGRIPNGGTVSDLAMP